MSQPERRRHTPAQIYLRVAAIIAMPLALVALLPASYATWRVWQVADDAQTIATQNRSATCSFVTDLEERYHATARYIEIIEARKIPPFPGVDVAELKRTNANRKSTLDSFSNLHCPRHEEGE